VTAPPTDSHGLSATTTTTATTATTTRALLAAGVVAGPLFVGVVLAQALLREGFEPARHPLSLLSLGELGWIQVANFVVTGALVVVAAVGMRRVLDPDHGGTWGPRLMATFGVALVVGGIFPADPAFGFPLGTPDGAPEHLSWHGIVHGVAPAVGFLALTLACFVLARRDVHDGHRAWATAGRVTGVLVLGLSALPNIGGDPEGRFAPLWVALVLAFGWASTTVARLRTELA
jgi:hypothetical protein